MVGQIYQKKNLGILSSLEPCVEMIDTGYRIIVRKEYDIRGPHSYELEKQVEDRERFGAIVDYMRRIYKVEGCRQEVLKHTYILEASNKQDLLTGAYYIMTKLIAYGMVREEKMIDLTEGCLEMPVVRQLEEFGDKRSLNEFLEDEAVCVWIEPQNKQRIDLKRLAAIKQRPLFILVEQNEGAYPKAAHLRKQLFPESLERLKVGAVVLEIDSLNKEVIQECLEAYFSYQGISLAVDVNLGQLVQEIQMQGLGEEDIRRIADTIISKYWVGPEKDEHLTKKVWQEVLGCNEDSRTQKVSDEIKAFIGLESYKQQIDHMICQMKFSKLRQEQGLKPMTTGLNAAFLGPSGTAKTTMGRLFAVLLKEEGLLQEEAFVECRKSDLLGKYVGWTAEKVDQLFSNLHRRGGGIILFDEIYSLTEEECTAFDTEALNCIVQNMEIYRSVICIFAGYEDKMQLFLEKNPGLRSRIPFTFYFNPYTLEELNQILKYQADKAQVVLPKRYNLLTQPYFKKRQELRGNQFGNGREARSLLEVAVMQMSSRIITNKLKSRQELMKLELSDLEQAISILLEEETYSNKKKRIGFSR